MRQDCDNCGEYTLCDKYGICAVCRLEEEPNEQDGEEETEEDQEDESEASHPGRTTSSSSQD